jgi:hypothetical protein
VTLCVGPGMVRSGAGATGGGRPSIYLSLGAPGQFPVPTAAARWTKSPALRPDFWKRGN